MIASIAGSTKAIALIAHDKQKAALLDFARRHRAVLATNLGSAEALVCSLIPPARPPKVRCRPAGLDLRAR